MTPKDHKKEDFRFISEGRLVLHVVHFCTTTSCGPSAEYDRSLFAQKSQIQSEMQIRIDLPDR